MFHWDKVVLETINFPLAGLTSSMADTKLEFVKLRSNLCQKSAFACPAWSYNYKWLELLVLGQTDRRQVDNITTWGYAKYLVFVSRNLQLF